MEALVKYANEPGRVEIREMPRPRSRPTRCLLRVRAVGICGSDLEMYHHKITFPVNPPVILGHEFSGTVAEVGANVATSSPATGWSARRRPMSAASARECRTRQLQPVPQPPGLRRADQRRRRALVAVRQGILHHVPDNVDLAEAALTEPLCVAYNALVVKSRIRPGDVVVVLGPGPIGLMATQVARVCGASHDHPGRAGARCARGWRSGSEVGATHTVDLGDDDLPAPGARPERRARRRPGGGRRRAVGHGQAGDGGGAPQRPDHQDRLGTAAAGPSLDPLLAKAVTFQGVFSHTWDTWERALRLAATGQVNLARPDQPSRAVAATGRPPLTRWKAARRSRR